jgi:hypothetical protein
MSNKLTDVDLRRFDESLAQIRHIVEGEKRANASAELIESVADWPFGEEFVARTVGPALERYLHLTALLDQHALLYPTLSPESFSDPWVKAWQNVLQRLEQLLLERIRVQPGCANFQLAPSEDLVTQITQFQMPKLAFDQQFFKTCETLEEAQAYIRRLPWDQRLQVWRVPVTEWRFAKKLSSSNPLHRLRRSEAYLSLSDAGPPPTQKQVNELAVTIYRVVKRAKKLAEREGKPLRIQAAELHTCLEGVWGTNVLTRVAALLGIEVIGVEGGRDRTHRNFEDKRLEAKRSYDSGVLPPETDEHSKMPERQRQSQAFQILAALEAGYRLEDIVDCDPLRETGTHPERHEESARILKKIAKRGQNCLFMQGAMHTAAMHPEMVKDTSAHTLVFNTSHALYNWSTDTYSENLADAVILDRHNMKDLAIGNEIIQIVVPGGEIRSTGEAFALSRGAQKAFRIRVLIAELTELLIKTPVRYVLGLTTGSGAGAVATTVTGGNAARDSIIGAVAGIGVVKIAAYARTKQTNRMLRNGSPDHSPIAKRRR